MTDRSKSNAVFVHRDVWKALNEAARQAAGFKEDAQRARADFLNYQKRARREPQEASDRALKNFVLEFLPALDSLAEAQRSAKKTDDVLDGLRIIHKEFLRVLAKHGITPMKSSGKPFDPNFHEAVSMVETAEAEDGTIVEEIRQGWMIRGRVLRAAMVRVAKSPKG